jgi:hypothetical protein
VGVAVERLDLVCGARRRRMRQVPAWPVVWRRITLGLPVEVCASLGGGGTSHRKRLAPRRALLYDYVWAIRVNVALFVSALGREPGLDEGKRKPNENKKQSHPTPNSRERDACRSEASRQSCGEVVAGGGACVSKPKRCIKSV